MAKERTTGRKVLLGIVPVSTQTPPTQRRFLITVARLPTFAALTAARWPAGPLAMTIRSVYRSRICWSITDDDRTEELRLRALVSTTVGSFTASIAA